MDKEQKRQLLQQTLKKLTDICGDSMEYLHDRWADEREYEDFADYAKQMEKMAADCNVTFIKGTKSPFGFQFKVEGIDLTVQFAVKVRGSKLEFYLAAAK